MLATTSASSVVIRNRGGSQSGSTPPWCGVASRRAAVLHIASRATAECGPTRWRTEVVRAAAVDENQPAPRADLHSAHGIGRGGRRCARCRSLGYDPGRIGGYASAHALEHELAGATEAYVHIARGQ